MFVNEHQDCEYPIFEALNGRSSSRHYCDIIISAHCFGRDGPPVDVAEQRASLL